jgi:hypothetical protein
MQARTPLSVFVISLLLSNLGRAQEETPKLRIVVVSGQGTINNIHSRSNPTPVVEVQDQNRKPLPGVPVVFFLPSQGPGGVFSNSSTTLTANTDSQGRAAASGIRFNRQTGSFDIRVSASYQGETASTTISETNVSGSSSSSGGGGGIGFGTKAWIILGIAAGAAVTAAILATRSRSNAPGLPPIVITPGTPTVGAPQ